MPTEDQSLIEYELITLAELINAATADMKYGNWFSLKEAIDRFSPATDLPNYHGLDDRMISRSVAVLLRGADWYVAPRAWIGGYNHTSVWKTEAQHKAFWRIRSGITEYRSRQNNPRTAYDLSLKHTI